jgi:hypothetical protein
LEINDEALISLTGDASEYQSVLLGAGIHRLRFTYTEFGGGPNGNAEVWIDNFFFVPGYVTQVDAKPEHLKWDPLPHLIEKEGAPLALSPLGTDIQLSFEAKDESQFLSWEGDHSSATSLIQFTANQHRKLAIRREFQLDFAKHDWTFRGTGRVDPSSSALTWKDSVMDTDSEMEATLIGPGLFEVSVDPNDHDLAIMKNGVPVKIATMDYAIRLPQGPHSLRFVFRPSQGDGVVMLKNARWREGVTLVTNSDRGEVVIEPKREVYLPGETVELRIKDLGPNDSVVWMEEGIPDQGLVTDEDRKKITLSENKTITASVTAVKRFNGQDWTLSHLGDWYREKRGGRLVSHLVPFSPDPNLSSVVSGPGILELSASLLWLDQGNPSPSSSSGPGALQVSVGGVQAIPLDNAFHGAIRRYRIPEGDHLVEISYQPPQDGYGVLWIEDLQLLQGPVDGLPDSWLRRHFNAQNLLELDISGAGMDPDGDGRTNWEEFAFGNDPNQPSSQTLSISREDRGAMGLRFSRPRDTSRVLYTVEFSNDFSDWIARPDWIADVIVSEISSELEQVELSLHADALEADARFIRIRAVEAPR